MSTPLLHSFRRQQLVLDFSSLQYACPEGIYLSLSPDKPSFWSGVLFVRSGPYASAVLRFHLSFPQTYPELPPLLTFSTDIFHPLVVPLTTYTFSTGALDAVGTVSASDDERLPPGSFSLRNAFPQWFGRKASVRNSIGSAAGLGIKDNIAGSSSPVLSTTGIQIITAPGVEDSRGTTLRVLEHVKAAFEDETLLDNIALEAAGNPSAWHAWRAHRGLTKQQARGRSPVDSSPDKSPPSPRHPGEWNWDGVWESRVHDGIENSLSEAALFNNVGQIRFSKLEDERLEEIRNEMLPTRTELGLKMPFTTI